MPAPPCASVLRWEPACMGGDAQAERRVLGSRVLGSCNRIGRFINRARSIGETAIGDAKRNCLAKETQSRASGKRHHHPEMLPESGQHGLQWRLCPAEKYSCAGGSEICRCAGGGKDRHRIRKAERPRFDLGRRKSSSNLLRFDPEKAADPQRRRALCRTEILQPIAAGRVIPKSTPSGLTRGGAGFHAQKSKGAQLLTSRTGRAPTTRHNGGWRSVKIFGRRTAFSTQISIDNKAKNRRDFHRRFDAFKSQTVLRRAPIS